MTGKGYVHGYSGREARRLADQAATLEELLHHDSVFPAGSRLLEAGCGVGAQTVILARKNPRARITSIDLSPDSLRAAERRIRGEKIGNVEFRQADIFRLPFEEGSFDHVFVCFVLEHLKEPLAALAKLSRMVRKGGSMTVIEGDHGSCYFHPESKAARAAWECLIEAQARLGGNSLIGRELYPLLAKAGLRDIAVSPRMVYSDRSRPALADGFVRKTIIAMVKGVREQALAAGLIDRETWGRGIRDLYRTARANGTFCYTFFKATGRKGG